MSVERYTGGNYRREVAEALRSFGDDRVSKRALLSFKRESLEYKKARRSKLEDFKKKEPLKFERPKITEAEYSVKSGKEARVSSVVDVVFGNFDKLAPALRAWKEVGSEGDTSFQELAFEGLKKRIKEDWGRINHENIAKLIRIRIEASDLNTHVRSRFSHYTDHFSGDVNAENMVELERSRSESSLLGLVSTHLLKEYFDAPKDDEGLLEALNTLGHAVIDLRNDPRAFDEGVLMMNFQTLAMPFSGRAFKAFVMGASEVKNEKMLQKALTFDSVANNLLSLSSFAGYQKIIEAKDRQANSVSESLDWVKRSKDWQDKRFKKKTILNRLELLERIGQRSKLKTEEIDSEKDNEWPFNVLLRGDNDLLDRYYRELSPLVPVTLLGEQFKDRLKINSAYTMSLFTPGGYGVDAYLPNADFFKKRAEIVKLITGVDDDADIVAKLEKKSVIGGVVQMREFNYKGEKVYINIRKMTKDEEIIHPLFRAKRFGMPVLRSPEGKGIAEAASSQAEYVRRNQDRFFDVQGMKLDLKKTEMRQYGFDSIVVRREAEDSKKLVVDVDVSGLVFSVKMDRDEFDFDYEDKEQGDRRFSEKLRYMLLRWLAPRICNLKDSVDVSGDENGGNGEKVVKSRAGQLVYLPEGYSFRERQTDLFKESEGRDLGVESERRKLADDRQRNSTWRSAVVDKSLPPRRVVVKDEELG